MKLQYITDLNSEALAPYARLTEAQLRNRLEPEQGLFICESEKVIRVALQAGCRPLSVLTEAKFLPTVERLVGEREVPVLVGEREVLASLTGYELSRGMLCAMHRPTLPDVDTLLRGCQRVAVMHSVVNSTNTGAIFRAAAALGIEALLLTPTCCDPLNRRACRVSMGTVFQIPWTYLPNFGLLRTLGFSTVALALTDRSVDIADPTLQHHERIAIVMGTEGDGLPDEVLRQCDYVARIPMRNGVDSLNVAAAAAVAFYVLGK